MCPLRITRNPNGRHRRGGVAVEMAIVFPVIFLFFWRSGNGHGWK